MKSVRLLSVSFHRGGYRSVEGNVTQMIRHLEGLWGYYDRSRAMRSESLLEPLTVVN